MTAPLYLGHASPIKKPVDAHAGLWFERFFNAYRTTEENWEIPDPDKKQDPKRDWIKTVAGPAGSKDRLKQFAGRQTVRVRHLNGRSQRYRADWHFVAGMGNPHPVENGLSWHPTLGVPYLTGAAVKGLVRAWVEGNHDDLPDAERKTRLERWFGSEQKGDVAERAGGFIFFDAVPDDCPSLICDIMTPHMGKWYAEGMHGNPNNHQALPADWHQPTPLAFLAVSKISLVFAIAPRGQEMAGELDAVFAALGNALEWLGAGAKTAVGYGYMTQDESFSREQEEQQRQSAMTPEQRHIDALRQQLQQKQNGKVHEQIGGPLYSALRELIAQTTEWPSADKAELLTVAKELLEHIGAAKNAKAKELLKNLQT